MVSSPSGVTETAVELSTISAPDSVADSASALITVCRTIENTRLPCQRCTEMTRFWSSRTSRVWANGAPWVAAA